MDIRKFWNAALRQDAEAMKSFFAPEAVVHWHNTNEKFTAEEFIKVNCAYPDKWDGKIERIESIGNLIITAVHVFALNKPLSFHVTSFIEVKNGKIIYIDEYWGDDGPPPKWRLNLLNK